MKPMRNLPTDIRAARLYAAKEYAPGSMPRKGILSGHWDGGSVVRKYLTECK